MRPRAAAKVEPDGSGIEMPSRYVGETLDLFFVSFYLVTTTPRGGGVSEGAGSWITQAPKARRLSDS